LASISITFGIKNWRKWTAILESNRSFAPWSNHPALSRGQTMSAMMVESGTNSVSLWQARAAILVYNHMCTSATAQPHKSIKYHNG
jgi:hypothetical protein